MTETEFYSLYQDTLLSIEDAIEELDADLDLESMDGVLTVSCPDGSQIIITPQRANQQLWLAARSGGFHFVWDEDDSEWQLTKDSTPLREKLQAVFQEQAGLELDL